MKVKKYSNLWKKIQQAYKLKKTGKLDSGWILIELFYDDLNYSPRKRSKFSRNSKKDFFKFSNWFHKKLGADYAYAIDSVIHEKWVTPYFLFGLLRQLQYMHKQNLTFRDNMLYEQFDLNIYPVNKVFVKNVMKTKSAQELSKCLLEMLCCEELNYDITKIDLDILDYVFKEWYDKLNGCDYKKIIDKYLINELDVSKLIKNIQQAKKQHLKFKSYSSIK